MLKTKYINVSIIIIISLVDERWLKYREDEDFDGLQ